MPGPQAKDDVLTAGVYTACLLCTLCCMKPGSASMREARARFADLLEHDAAQL